MSGHRTLSILLRCGWLPAALAFATLAASGCYDPHIQSGGLKCASPPHQCPDGFSCAAGVCVSGSGAGQGGKGGGGTGGSGGTCPNQITPLCTPTQTLAPCDPVCQTGCPCGQRCEVGPAGLKCAPSSGTLTLGMPCKPEADACAPGLTCLQEACGNDLGRCYRFCRADANVCGAGVCGTPVLLPDRSDSQQRVCDLAGQTCDPYLGTGCVDPALVCYAAGPSQSTCDCPSGANVAVGAPCTLYNDCASGLACLHFAAGADGTSSDSRCVKLCQTSDECPGSVCQPFAPTFGYCML